MARIRSLKPECFKDEDLATLPYEARLLFMGLWCFADKEGRLEDRPKYLKAEIFPYDNINIEKYLNMLCSPNINERPDKVFIRRYVVNGRKYIDIPEFLKHQSPHHTEKESILPSFNGELTVISTLDKGNGRDEHYPISLSESLSESESLKKKQKTKHLDSVFLDETEYKKLQEVLGQKNLDNAIEKLDYSITVKGGKYKDHYKTIINWNNRGFLNGNGNGSGFTGSTGSTFKKAGGAQSDGQPYPVDAEY